MNASALEWFETTLGESFQTVTGNTPPKSKIDLYGDAIPLVKPPELNDGEVGDATDGLSAKGSKVARIAPVGSTLVSCIGNLGKIGLTTAEVAFNQQINAIFPAPSIAIPEFVYFLTLSPQFRDQLLSLSSGTTVPIVNKTRFNSIKLQLPLLEEQKRIVAVLDQAFAALDRARAHAEANLADASALFESKLRTAFEQSSVDAVSLTFDQLCAAVTPKTKIKRQDYLEDGLYPVVSQEADKVSGYWNNQEDVMRIDGPVVVFGDHTRCLKYIDFDFVAGADGTKVLKPNRGVTAAYLYYGLRSQHIESGGYARHFKFLREKSLPDISLEEQIALTKRLKEIECRCEYLTVAYEAKLTDIANLRQSLLQKAFSGQLT